MVPDDDGRRRPGRAAGARRPRLAPARRRGGPRSDASARMAGGSITHGAPPRPPRPRSPRSPPASLPASTASIGLPDERRRRRRAQRAALVERPRATPASRIPPDDDPAPTSPSAGSGRRWSPGPSSVTPASPAPTWRTAAASPATGCPRRWWPRCSSQLVGRAVRVRLLRRHRQGRPRVRPRRRVYDAELRLRRPAWSPYLLDVLPPAAALVVTADHGQVDVGDRHRHPRTPRC